jgi:hypothetical protein
MAPIISPATTSNGPLRTANLFDSGQVRNTSLAFRARPAGECAGWQIAAN